MDTETREVVIRANGAIAALRQLGAEDAHNSILGVMQDLLRTVKRLSQPSANPAPVSSYAPKTDHTDGGRLG